MKVLVQSLIFDVQISHWPPVAAYVQLSSRVSKWLVTNNCKVILPVPSKKKIYSGRMPSLIMKLLYVGA